MGMYSANVGAGARSGAEVRRSAGETPSRASSIRAASTSAAVGVEDGQTGLVGVGGQEHAIAGGQAAPVAQGGGDAQVALTGDVTATGRVGDDGERPVGFADVEAVSGGPAQRAQDDPIGDSAAIVDRRRAINHGGGALQWQVGQR